MVEVLELVVVEIVVVVLEGVVDEELIVVDVTVVVVLDKGDEEGVSFFSSVVDEVMTSPSVERVPRSFLLEVSLVLSLLDVTILLLLVEEASSIVVETTESLLVVTESPLLVVTVLSLLDVPNGPSLLVVA